MDSRYLKLSRPLGPRRGYVCDLPVSHLPPLWGRHELEHASRPALLPAEGAKRYNVQHATGPFLRNWSGVNIVRLDTLHETQGKTLFNTDITVVGL